MRIPFLALTTCLVVLVLAQRRNSGFPRSKTHTTSLPRPQIWLGNITRQNEFPWMVHVKSTFPNGVNGTCGGSLIHPRWVITAAHCVRTLVANRIVNSNVVKLTFGKHDLAKPETGQVTAVARWSRGDILVHPQYDHEKFYYDVALVKIRRRLRQGTNISVIELTGGCTYHDRYASTVDGCARAVAAGWGLTETGDPSNLLRKVDLALVSFSSCRIAYGVNYTASQICALGVTGHDTCQGDSGGPLMCFNDAIQKYQLIGVTSSGDKCTGNRGLPGMYTRICRVTNWIRRSGVPRPQSPLQQDGCSSAPYVENGSFGDGSNVFGVQRRLVCRQNFVRQGPEYIYCMNNRQWSPEGTCMPISTSSTASPTRCVIPNTANGVIRQIDNITGAENRRPVSPGDHVLAGTTVRMRCNAGSIQWGTTFPSICTENAWKPPIGTCTLIRCASVPKIEHGNTSNGSNYFLNASRSITCNRGFRLSGASTIRCSEDGHWSEPGRCHRIVCGTLPPLRNGLVVPGGWEHGSTRVLRCYSHYTLRGSAVVECLENGQWSNPGKCEPTQCSQHSIPVVRNGRFVSLEASYNVRDRIFAICNTGFRSNLPVSATCRRNGNWTVPNRFCVPVTCAGLPFVADGRISNGTSSAFGEKRYVTCNDGFRIQGTNSVTCQAGGFWSTPGTCEAITCSSGSVPVLTNGSFSTENVGSLHANHVIYGHCESGYKASSNISITCLSDGQWARSSGECQEYYVKPATKDKDTPIFAAARSGNVTEVRRLVEDGVNLNSIYKNKTPIHFACVNGHLLVIKYMLETSPNLTYARTSVWGALPIHKAAWGGHVDIVRFFVEEKSVDIDARNRYPGNTPLHLAADGNRLDVIKWLVRNGANVYATTTVGHNTAVHLPCYHGHLDVVKYFIKQINGNFTSAIGLYGYFPIHGAARFGRTNVIKYFVLEHGEDVDVKIPGSGQTSLHIAAGHGHLTLVQWLLDNGADPFAKRNDKRTALHNAAAKGRLSVVKHLAENYPRLLTIADDDGNMPLNEAETHEKNDYVEVREYLRQKIPADAEVSTTTRPKFPATPE